MQNSRMTGTDADVAIIGFGPVGAVLAGLLGRRGLRVVVIERDSDIYPLPRTAHIDHQSMRALQEIGCLDELLPTMLPNPGLDFLAANGQLLIRIPGNQLSVSGTVASMYFFQPLFDRTLRAAVEAMSSVEVRLGTRMTALDQGTDRVTVHTTGPKGERESLTASWVVGCDGASSSVREATGISNEDLMFDENWLVVDLINTGPAPNLPKRALNVCDPERPFTAIPLPLGRFRFEFMLLPGEDPVAMQAPATVLPLLARWVHQDSAQIERTAVYTFHGLLARRWRVGRVLLAGDAAHQMPPFLGQGMNSGVRDATNLAWKLDHVLSYRAPAALLDTYEGERRPHVRTIIEAAIAFGRITCTTDRNEADARDRRFLADPRPPTERLPFRLPSLGPGPLVGEAGGALFIQPPAPGSSPRLDDVVGQRFLVLARDAEHLGDAGRWWSEELGAFTATLDGLPIFRGPLEQWLDQRHANVVVVRPDRYVVAAADDLDQIAADVRQSLVVAE